MGAADAASTKAARCVRGGDGTNTTGFTDEAGKALLDAGAWSVRRRAAVGCTSGGALQETANASARFEFLLYEACSHRPS